MTSRPAAPAASPLHAVQSLLYLIVIAIFIVAFIAQPFQIPSGSMEPTLLVGDFLLVSKQLPSRHDPLPAAPIQHGDIIVFHYPVDPTLHLVKRVIGLPGDRIRLRAGRVFRNDRLLEEPYTFLRPGPPDSFRDNFPRMTSTEPGIESRWWIEMRSRIDAGNLVVPPGQYFVLGDNRNNSQDSRFWGFVPEAAVVGRPFLVYFSLRLSPRTDDPATPEFEAAPHPPPVATNLLTRLAHLARWHRALHVIR